MIPEDDNLTRMIQGLRSGDPQILQEFWTRYEGPLERIAERNLAAGMRRRFGAEDVVQSVCRTFFRRMQGGEFQLSDSEGLWRLLCAITLTKVREKVRYHQRARRGLQNEVPPPDSDSVAAFVPEAADPRPDEAAEFTDLLETVLASLDAEERQLLEFKLQDFTHEEVAERMGCSERTVRRLLKRVQEHLEQILRNEH